MNSLTYPIFIFSDYNTLQVASIFMEVVHHSTPGNALVQPSLLRFVVHAPTHRVLQYFSSLV